MVWQVRFPQNKQHNLKIKTNGIKTKQNLPKSDRHPEKTSNITYWNNAMLYYSSAS